MQGNPARHRPNPALAALFCHGEEHLSDAASEPSGIADARRHTNNNEMAVHVAAVSSSRFSIGISRDGLPGKATQRSVISQFLTGAKIGDIHGAAESARALSPAAPQWTLRAKELAIYTATPASNSGALRWISHACSRMRERPH